ncbi:hypothetical protein PALB_3010 [Pseudoalteromonas luteoviolacea B = ATCC 29581]|nr:hypothetical protein PALB_3010 [Pseudoalteromonas luteoviolacea B = ATCC 29581]
MLFGRSADALLGTFHYEQPITQNSLTVSKTALPASSLTPQVSDLYYSPSAFFAKIPFGSLDTTSHERVQKTPHSHLVELPERNRLTHPSYFLHPAQRADYQLVFVLADDDPPRTLVYRTNRFNITPWYFGDTRARRGLINDCQPANLTYRSLLLFEQHA